MVKGIILRSASLPYLKKQIDNLTDVIPLPLMATADAQIIEEYRGFMIREWKPKELDHPMYDIYYKDEND